MSNEELDLGELSSYSGGLCLNLVPGMKPERVALVAEAVNAQSGNLADKRAFVDRLRARGEDEFAAVALASVFVHETRHFHDLLLSHVGQWLVMEGVHLAAALPQTLFHLSLQRACVLPIPRWCDLPSALHTALTGGSSSAELAPRPDQYLMSRLASLAGLEEMTDFFYRPPADAPPYAPTTTLLFEGLATSCQLAELNRIDSGNCATVEPFVRRLEARQARSYIDYFDYIETAAKQLDAGLLAEHWTVFNLLALRALCPLTRTVTAEGEPQSLPPALVFLAGIADLYARRSIPTPEEAVTWLDTLGDRLGWLTLDETFAAMQQMAPRRLAAVAPLFDPALPAEAALLQGYAAWIAAHQHMLAEVRRDPLRYCDPFAYGAAVETWVACPVHLPIVAGNLPEVEGFLRGLDGADPRAVDSLLARGLRPGFLPIGASHGANLLPVNDHAALFDGIRLGHGLWRGFRPGQIAGLIARAELRQALQDQTRVFFL